MSRAKPVPVMANQDSSDNVSPEQPATASTEKPTASSHDTYVYKTLSNPAAAAAEFKHQLPNEVVAEIDWDNLEQDTNRFSNENLDNHYTDLLFKTTLRGGPIKLRLLVEHSSYNKPFELLQVLRYHVEQWERESQQKKAANDKQQRLTPIITLILHHSESGWRGRPRFMDYFGLDADLARLLEPFVVDFGIVLDDVSKVDAAALLQRPVPPEVQLLLFGLRFAREGREILKELPKMRPVIKQLVQGPNGQLAIGVFLVYLQRVAKVSEADVEMTLQELFESRLDPEIMAVYKRFDAAKKEGIQEGLKEGELKMLKRLLTQRFGVLSPATVARLESATLAQLEAMTLRVLTAASVDDVLG